MSIRFIEGVSTKDKALQTAIRAFAVIRFGGSLTQEEAKLFIDICSLALPMKYRFPRATWGQIKVGVKQRIAEKNESR
jgi:hypothetical protein